MEQFKWEEMLACPVCRSDVESGEAKETLICVGCKQCFSIVDGIPVFYEKKESDSWDLSVANDKWQEFYNNFDWEQDKNYYALANLPYIYKHATYRASDTFLEIGGGPSYLAFDLSEKIERVFVVDFDLNILRLAKKYFEKHNRKVFFICANVNTLPFKDGLFDFSVGMGVIEHTKQIDLTIEELFRVTKPNGYTFQTVPYFSLFTIINNSLRFGSFTPFSFFNKFLYWLHVKLLASRRMLYGYEELYTKKILSNYFAAANFHSFKIEFYDYNQSIFKKYKILRSFFYNLLRLKIRNFTPFADIVYIKAYKK